MTETGGCQPDPIAGRAERYDFIVIDTENKGNFLRADQAADLARQLEADYYTVEALQAEYLSELIQSRTLS